ncbi:DUF805 domain-containing protein [Rhizobium sp. BK251]|uniref:DUF805 domain-containing protein n=1 Tax=Rhizobium sp. BK251 TaxID=2512125 RepID=UPI00104FB7DA|nr:DUF805 domain-containing protein [Rhizobium sp. BK251]TCL72274.1 uncharacterized membrane protein YhaH (DUF805 family) [Rhizobium sp. BK251]
MTFTEAVGSVFSKYAVFRGRAPRSEFWWFALFNIVLSFVAGLIDAAFTNGDVLAIVYSLAVFLPGLAVAVRRLHDIDRSGWWLLIGFIPLAGWVILIYWYIQEGTLGANQFGPAV